MLWTHLYFHLVATGSLVAVLVYIIGLHIVLLVPTASKQSATEWLEVKGLQEIEDVRASVEN